MATSGFATFSTRSFYGSRARAQRDRSRVPLIEPNFEDSDKESDYDEDEANIADEESNYSSPSEDESGEDDADVVEDDDTESIEAEAEAAGSSKTGSTSQNVRWRKRQPVCLVQFLTSPLSTHPYIGAEPGRAKRRVQDNLHAHAQNEPIKNL